MTDLVKKGPLTVAEQDLLVQCEETISEGIQTFVEVGQALMSVRDNRLYRATHPTFDAYVEERWGFTKGRANQLVRAAAVAELISDTTVPEIKNARSVHLETGDHIPAPFASIRWEDCCVRAGLAAVWAWAIEPVLPPDGEL